MKRALLLSLFCTALFFGCSDDTQHTVTVEYVGMPADLKPAKMQLEVPQEKHAGDFIFVMFSYEGDIGPHFVNDSISEDCMKAVIISE